MGVSVPGEATTEGQPAPPIRSFVEPLRSAFAPVAGLLRSLEVDTRMLGMVAALAVIWIAFDIVSGGTFLSPRNLWNLSVQTASIGIMATGMVLIIVSRNIDLSVGSMLGFLGYTMAMFQAVWIPKSLGLGFEQPYTWILTLVVGIALGAVIGGLQGFIVAFGGVPSFIVTLGGLLIWRGLIFRYQQGQTIAPLDTTFQMLGGGTVGTRVGALGEWPSWALGAVICVAIVFLMIAARRRRRRYGFQVRPMWAEVLVGAVACGVVLGTVWVANSYPLPPNVADAVAQERGIPVPPGGIPTGIAFPVVIMLIVTLVVTFLATRRRFGRSVYAIGGNPEADRVHVAPETASCAEKGHDERDDQHDHDRESDAGRNPARRHRDPTFLRDRVRDVWRERVTVGDPHRSEHDAACDRTDEDFGPHRPNRKT